MSLELTFPIDATTDLCDLVRTHGLLNFCDLTEHVRRLPYGRLLHGTSVEAVLTEQRGTCSSKHLLLASVANDCRRQDIRLMVGIYLMSEANTPSVGPVLAAAQLSAIPEAHCYLMQNQQRYDFTGLPAALESPFSSLLVEFEASPCTVATEKPRRHQAFVASWAVDNGLDPSTVWAVREKCINAIAANPSVPGLRSVVPDLER
jgi:hypothetical protein